jgi:hypothetical protein
MVTSGATASCVHWLLFTATCLMNEHTEQALVDMLLTPAHCEYTCVTAVIGQLSMHADE